MLDDVRSLTRWAVEILELLAVFCGIVLFAIAAISVLLATFRVAIRGRVFALPFTGNDDRRVELADLFIRRLSSMEAEWIDLAREIEGVRKQVNARADAHAEIETGAGAPLTSKGALPPLRVPSEQLTAVTATRTSGDELLYGVVQLGGIGSIGNADLGVISLAGVSFSPRDILALLRAAPGILARRTLRGSIITLAGGNLLTVQFEERRGRRRRRAETAEVVGDAWLAAIEDVAYRLEKQRIYLVRDRRPWRARLLGDRTDTRSKTVRQALIEAENWKACRSFLIAYAAHLKHYRDGSAAEREEALRSYDEALTSQSGFPRAAYNRAVLLYNRLLPNANDQAIEAFQVATGTADRSLMPLALAGLAMAHCQAIQRFKRKRDDHEQPAREAAEAAFALAPKLVEAAFARGWIHQIEGQWRDAVAQYLAVVDLEGGEAVERRMKSFALNNAAWITMYKLQHEDGALAQAEKFLWQALGLYPNKVAYANLAEIARRCSRYDDVISLFTVALSLDPAYTNAHNELAIVEMELAGRASASGHSEKSRHLRADAHEHARAAQRLAQEDPAFADVLRREFDEAEAALAAVSRPPT
jgi:tetratricopeptide (TPR) repeat protein